MFLDCLYVYDTTYLLFSLKFRTPQTCIVPVAPISALLQYVYSGVKNEGSICDRNE